MDRGAWWATVHAVAESEATEHTCAHFWDKLKAEVKGTDCKKVKEHVSRSVLSDSLWTPCSPSSSVHGILQARILEWVAVSFSRGSSLPRDQTESPASQADSLRSEPPGRASQRAGTVLGAGAGASEKTTLEE